jgi:hypothetical protein
MNDKKIRTKKETKRISIPKRSFASVPGGSLSKCGDTGGELGGDVIP